MTTPRQDSVVIKINKKARLNSKTNEQYYFSKNLLQAVLLAVG
jgi:hypothetical protein